MAQSIETEQQNKQPVEPFEKHSPAFVNLLANRNFTLLGLAAIMVSLFVRNAQISSGLLLGGLAIMVMRMLFGYIQWSRRNRWLPYEGELTIQSYKVETNDLFVLPDFTNGVDPRHSTNYVRFREFPPILFMIDDATARDFRAGDRVTFSHATASNGMPLVKNLRQPEVAHAENGRSI